MSRECRGVLEKGAERVGEGARGGDRGRVAGQLGFGEAGDGCCGGVWGEEGDAVGAAA